MEERTETEPRKIIRIAITGPESTGKSRLTSELATHYHSFSVPEYARYYLNTIKREYNYKDLQLIAKRQIDSENYRMKKTRKFLFRDAYLFCDTELTVMKIWSLYKFGICPRWIQKNLDEIHYDFYLLCNIDLPWEPDPLREHSDLRNHFFNKYFNELTSRNLPFVVISGKGKKRTQNAINAIDNLRLI